jgi:hypothetical protein
MSSSRVVCLDTLDADAAARIIARLPPETVVHLPIICRAWRDAFGGQTERAQDVFARAAQAAGVPWPRKPRGAAAVVLAKALATREKERRQAHEVRLAPA